MTDALASMPTFLRKRLVRGLDTGALVAPYSAAALQMTLGQADAAALAALERLAAQGITGRTAAEWIRTLDRAAGPTTLPDLVWSGPEVPGVPARDTRRVYEELFTSANRSLWAVSYAYFDGRSVFDLLARRMEAVPELRVTLLLNIHRRQNDTSRPDEMVRRFAARFWKEDWPGDARPTVFYDPRSIDPSVRGVLHAKALVADEERVFVTSANFTAAAQDDNIELGLLVRSRSLALGVVRHLQGLIDRGLLRSLPDE